MGHNMKRVEYMVISNGFRQLRFNGNTYCVSQRGTSKNPNVVITKEISEYDYSADQHVLRYQQIEHPGYTTIREAIRFIREHF